MMKPTASIIIPTYNNPEYFNPCVKSIAQTGALTGLCELIVVNNGSQPIDEMLKEWPNTRVLNPGKNLGWEGGLAAGLDVAQGDFVCFQNDDTLIPKATDSFYSQLLWPFQDKTIAAVGPSTTIASGWHSVFSPATPRTVAEVSYLIFFTVMIRRADLEKAGGIDLSAPGGDDFDLSMRLRKIGQRLIINPDAFLIHHAFKTGTRVRGEASKAGGWNSKEMTDRTNQWLIQKHGFINYLQTMRGLELQFASSVDSEGQAVADMVTGQKVIELGCGFRKSVPHAIGIDQAAKGDAPSNIVGGASVADIQADITKPLPLEDESVDCIIARHCLEHCIDVVGTLLNWSRVLKSGGRMIIAVPNQDIIDSIPLNPEHVHAFTPDSLANILKLVGFRSIETRDPKNGISFVSSFEKEFHVELPSAETKELAHA